MPGLLDDKQAYHRLSVLSRQFASEKLGKDVTKHTLAELKRETPDRNSRDGYLALRQTVEALTRLNSQKLNGTLQHRTHLLKKLPNGYPGL